MEKVYYWPFSRAIYYLNSLKRGISDRVMAKTTYRTKLLHDIPYFKKGHDILVYLELRNHNDLTISQNSYYV